MTISTNQAVITYYDYSTIKEQDFQVIFTKNSEEEDQEMTYEIVDVKENLIKVQLTFEDPILVS